MLKKYKIQQGQTIEDVCVAVYGSTQYLTKLQKDNSFITYIGMNEAYLVGKVIVYDDTYTLTTPSVLNINNTNALSDVLTKTAINGQSIYDLAIQTYGTLEKVVDLAFNNGIDLTKPDQVKNIRFSYRKSEVKDYFLHNFMKELGTNVGGTYIMPVYGAFDKSFDNSFNITT